MRRTGKLNPQLNPYVDKQEMRNYLLGTSEADRKAQLEERILCDPAAYEELLFIEEELIDQYLSDGLSDADRHQFETNFLITAERQKNLRFDRLLKRYVHSHPDLVPSENIAAAVRQAEKPTPASRFFSFPIAPFSRGPAVAFAAVVVTALLGLLTFCWLATRKSAERVADSSHVIEVTLMPGSLRSVGPATQRLSVPPKGFDVQLDLQLSNTSFHNYKSELFRENESVQTADELKMEAKGDQHIVPITIAGDMLSPGDYQVKLSGVLDSGQDEFIDNYSFRVIE